MAKLTRTDKRFLKGVIEQEIENIRKEDGMTTYRKQLKSMHKKINKLA